MQKTRKNEVIVESVGGMPVFAVFSSKPEAFMAMLNIAKEKIVLHET